MEGMESYTVILPASLDIQFEQISARTKRTKSDLTRQFLLEGFESLKQRFPKRANDAELNLAIETFRAAAKQVEYAGPGLGAPTFTRTPLPFDFIEKGHHVAFLTNCSENDVRVLFIQEGLERMAKRIEPSGSDTAKAIKLARLGRPRIIAQWANEERKGIKEDLKRLEKGFKNLGL